LDKSEGLNGKNKASFPPPPLRSKTTNETKDKLLAVALRAPVWITD